MINFDPLCFRVHCDCDEADVTSVLIKYGRIMFDNDVPIVFLDYDKTRQELTMALHKAKINEFWLEKVNPEKYTEQNSLVSVWYNENYAEQLQHYVEVEKQENLQKILQNIEKFTKERGDVYGGRTEEARQTEEN